MQNSQLPNTGYLRLCSFRQRSTIIIILNGYPYPDPRQALRDIEAHSKSPKDVIAELDAEEAAEKAASEKKITVEATSTSLSLLREKTFLEKTVRVFGTPEEPLFLARDVAEWIDHKDVTSMLRNIDEDEKIVITTNSYPPLNERTVLQANTSYSFLTENGLYEVLMLSRKPKAKEFKKKVKEILKTVRKTGGYINQGQEDLFIDTYLPCIRDSKLPPVILLTLFVPLSS